MFFVLLQQQYMSAIPVVSVHTPVVSVHTPVVSVHTPVVSVHTPVVSVHTPVVSVHTPVVSVHTPPGLWLRTLQFIHTLCSRLPPSFLQQTATIFRTVPLLLACLVLRKRLSHSGFKPQTYMRPKKSFAPKKETLKFSPQVFRTTTSTPSVQSGNPSAQAQPPCIYKVSVSQHSDTFRAQ